MKIQCPLRPGRDQRGRTKLHQKARSGLPVRRLQLTMTRSQGSSVTQVIGHTTARLQNNKGILWRRAALIRVPPPLMWSPDQSRQMIPLPNQLTVPTSRNKVGVSRPKFVLTKAGATKMLLHRMCRQLFPLQFRQCSFQAGPQPLPRPAQFPKARVWRWNRMAEHRQQSRFNANRG